MLSIFYWIFSTKFVFQEIFYFHIDISSNIIVVAHLLDVPRDVSMIMKGLPDKKCKG